jgi:hypothetical protein
MIRCKCGHCGYEIKTYDKFAGKRVLCPKCKEAVQIPPGEGGASPKPAAVIKFRCPNCDQKIGVPPEYGGKVVRCAKCKHRLRVPQAAGAAAHATPQDDMAALSTGQVRAGRGTKNISNPVSPVAAILSRLLLLLQ